MKPLITPIVNLNGSSAEELMNYRLNVCKELEKAVEALFQGMPHGRDYQTHPKSRELGGYSTVAEEAREAWRDRIEALRIINSELMADAQAIHDQVDWSRKRWAEPKQESTN